MIINNFASLKKITFLELFLAEYCGLDCLIVGYHCYLGERKQIIQVSVLGTKCDIENYFGNTDFEFWKVKMQRILIIQ